MWIEKTQIITVDYTGTEGERGRTQTGEVEMQSPAGGDWRGSTRPMK